MQGGVSGGQYIAKGGQHNSFGILISSGVGITSVSGSGTFGTIPVCIISHGGVSGGQSVISFGQQISDGMVSGGGVPSSTTGPNIPSPPSITITSGRLATSSSVIVSGVLSLLVVFLVSNGFPWRVRVAMAADLYAF